MTRILIIGGFAIVCACGAPAQAEQPGPPSEVEQRAPEGDDLSTPTTDSPQSSAETRLTASHFERIFKQLRDGISDEGLFAPAMTLHTLSASSETDLREDHEEARGWDLVLAMIERLQHSYRRACRQEEPPADCKWHVGIDYLGEPSCNATCCESSDPQRTGIPHLKRVCFDTQLRANAITIRTAR